MPSRSQLDPTSGTTKEREMEYAGILELIAELAVAVLGFSGVVAVLGRRSAGEWTQLDRIRFFSMVRLTVGVLVLAVLPFPFHFAGYTGDQTWGWLSAIGAAIMGLNLVATFLDGGFSEGTFTAQGTSRLAVAYSFTSAAISLALFTMNAAGIGLERSFTPYLVAILLTFGTPIVLFMRLLYSAIGSGRAA